MVTQLAPMLQEDSVPSSPLLSSGQKVNYQTDPRPHFGVAWSSHSTCRPLWGSEGPCWGQRHQDKPNQMHTCPHCHLGLPPDTLRWHEVVNTHRHKNRCTSSAKHSSDCVTVFNSRASDFFLSLHAQAKCLQFDGQRNSNTNWVIGREKRCLLLIQNNRPVDSLC